MNYVKLISPAKVNLVLAVGEKRADGFHEVSTILHSLALHDIVTMRKTPLEGTGVGLSLRLTCETSDDVDELDCSPEENIAYRAVVSLAEALGRTEDEHIDIEIIKRIPHQAGLGGGSSNAAAALLGAALLWDINTSDPRLFDVASALGSDVPFFLHGGCALLSGKGDLFEKRLTPRKGFVCLIRPDAGISTKDAYQAFDAGSYIPSKECLQELTDYDQACEVPLFNNMSKPSEILLPELTEIHALLDETEGVSEHILCGSGSAIMALCDSFDAASALAVTARQKGWYARTTSFAPIGVSVRESF